MLESINGFRISAPVTPPVAGAAATPPATRLRFLQFKDVFFSSASRKALTESFLNQTPDALGQQLPRPLVLHFGAAEPERHPMWNKFFPAHDVAAVSATPYWKHPV